jgi:hypothetical protein
MGSIPDIRQPRLNFFSCLASGGFPRGIAPWLMKLVLINECVTFPLHGKVWDTYLIYP